MSLFSNDLYEFGKFRLDVTEKLLHSEGKQISLTPKVFEMLLVFLKSNGKLISKDYLMNQVWADSFVEESNLTFTIRQLRKILNDDAHSPKFIETVPRRGYRFIAKVANEIEKNEEIAPKKIIEKPQTQQTKLFNQKYLAIGFASLLFLTLSLSAFYYRNHSKIAPILEKPFQTKTLVTSNSPMYAIISPNGKYFAYTDETNGKQSLWIKNLETENNVEILAAADFTYYGLAFSQDSENVYFARRQNGGKIPNTIYRISILGGIITKIAEKTEGWFSVSPDDKQIAFVRCLSQTENSCSLIIIDKEGANEKQLVAVPKPNTMTDVQWSPDGNKIAFANGNADSGGTNYSISEIEVANGAVKPIAENKFFHVKYLKWLPDGQNLLVSAVDKLGNPAKLWQLERMTGTLTQISKTEDFYKQISLDKSGQKMVATTITNNFRLHLFQTENPAKFEVLSNSTVVSFQSDGKVLYRDGNNLWIMQPDGTARKQLTFDANDNTPTGYSSDPNYIYFSSNRTGEFHVWQMKPDGSGQTQITKNRNGRFLYADADGKNIYFQTIKGNAIWKINLETFAETEVSAKPIFPLEFSPDGTKYAYFSDSKGELNVTIAASETKQILQVIPIIPKDIKPSQIGWLPDSNNIVYLVNGKDESYTLWSQPINGGNGKMIANLGKQQVYEISRISFSPDGKTFALARGSYQQNAILIEGLK